MKARTYLILFIGLIFACRKEAKKTGQQQIACIQIAQNSNWAVETFKNGSVAASPPWYTIQFPSEYSGPGIVYGLEGVSFSKDRGNDNSVRFRYLYPTGLSFLPWGSQLQQPEPSALIINSLLSGGQTITLDKKLNFCGNDSLKIGIYYYNSTVAYGRLYWKDNGSFKEALDVLYNFSRQQEVIDIIKTIKKN